MLDEKRLLEIYRLHKRELYVYIYRHSRSRETAEDILHDCFENLIKYSLKYNLEDGNLRSFLYKTAHNLCVNNLKKTRRFAHVPLEEESHVAGEEYVTGNAELEELNIKIYQTLDEMDEESRSIFIMKKELSRPLNDIAADLGISERTVRRKINKVIDHLAETLKKSGFI